MSSTAPDKGVPNDVLEKAKCVAVIPKLIKGAFVVAANMETAWRPAALPTAVGVLPHRLPFRA